MLNTWKSTILPTEILEKYTKVVSKLKSELQFITLDDQLWFLNSWDQSNIPVLKLQCVECNNGFGLNNGDHCKTTINNLFANSKASHIMSNMHIMSWCMPKDISFNDHPQCMATMREHALLIMLDYKAPVREGLAITVGY